jgi:hypothetical protein
MPVRTQRLFCACENTKAGTLDVIRHLDAVKLPPGASTIYWIRQAVTVGKTLGELRALSDEKSRRALMSNPASKFLAQVLLSWAHSKSFVCRKIAANIRILDARHCQQNEASWVEVYWHMDDEEFVLIEPPPSNVSLMEEYLNNPSDAKGPKGDETCLSPEQRKNIVWIYTEERASNLGTSSRHLIEKCYTAYAACLFGSKRLMREITAVHQHGVRTFVTWQFASSSSN